MSARRTGHGYRSVAIPAGTVLPPELRWPEDKRLAPTRCEHCGSRLWHDDAPYGLVRTGERHCGMCTRVLVRWRAGWGNRASVTVDPAAEDAASICLDCGNLTGQRVYAPGRKRLRCRPCDKIRDAERAREKYWGVGR